MDTLLRAADRVPIWIRAAAALALPVLAFVTAAFRGPVTITAFLVLTVAVLFLHAPALAFDGPLPFSDLGLHVGGEIHPWDEVLALEPVGEKDLQAVLADGSNVKVRVRGRRTREDLRAALVRHKPEAARF